MAIPALMRLQFPSKVRYLKDGRSMSSMNISNRDVVIIYNLQVLSPFSNGSPNDFVRFAYKSPGSKPRTPLCQRSTWQRRQRVLKSSPKNLLNP